MVSNLSLLVYGFDARKKGGVIMDALLDLQRLKVDVDSIDLRASGVSLWCGDDDPNSALSLFCGK